MVLSHRSVYQVDIRGEEASTTKGYLRIRLILENHDVVEVFVYLVEQEGSALLLDYSLHWQKEDGTLIQRWDTAPHHSELMNFPYHTHKAIGEVEATEVRDWESFVVLLERVMSRGPLG